MKRLFPSVIILCFIAINGLFCAESGHAQSIIYNANPHSEYSIIRNYDDHVDITHNIICDSVSFNYIDRSSLSVISAYCSGHFNVSDFVIFGDSVFFCGDSAGMCAVYGYFNIHDVFFSGGAINYRRIVVNNPIDTNYSRIIHLDKIAAGKALSGETHLLMVGRGYYYDVNINNHGSHYYYPGVIVDVKIDASGSNQVKYTVDRPYKLLYDDVIVADNYAIVSARSTSNTATCSHNFLYYSSPVNLGYSYFPSTPISNIQMWTTSQAVLTLPANDKIHLAKTTTDGFATVCHKYNGNGNNPFVISIYNDPLSIPTFRYELPFTDINCQEVVYNPLLSELYILPEMSSVLYGIRYPYTMSEIITAKNIGWTSIDNADNDNYEILSGWESPSFQK